MSDATQKGRLETVLVIGGGIAGLKSALDLAESGRQVVVTDKAPNLGGYLPLLDRQFPTNDCQICYLSPDMAPAGFDIGIGVMPLTEVVGVSGQAGDFTVELTTKPRYIDTELCTACGECLKAAPEGAVSFTPGLDHRSTTCLRYPQAVPQAFAINIDKVGQDTSWIKCCEPGAIKLDQKPESVKLNVGSIIVATGAELFDPTPLSDYFGYGQFPDVVTSLEFERILSPAGPTCGAFARPSDGRRPTRIGWVQCVGSRTTKAPGNPYCSSICCMFAMKEAAWAKEHFASDLDATIFYMDIRPMGKDYEQYYQRMKNDVGVNFVRCRPHTVRRDEATNDLLLSYATEDGQQLEAALDMLVLATGFCASKEAVSTAQALGIELDKYNFVKVSDKAPVSTSREGVYACGMSTGPKDIPDSLMQASAAACLASAHLTPPEPVRYEKDLPPERDTASETPKIGVFVADFGGNMAKYVDLAKVMAAAKTMPNVCCVEEIKVSYAGGQGLTQMIDSIKASGVNRVVVVGNSPRTHGKIYAEAVRRAGLNRAMVEIANVRDQDALVHRDAPEAATHKAIMLVRMAVGRVKLAKPIYVHAQSLDKTALVVGGGVAGLTAALQLAKQGISVKLVERDKQLGGMALNLAHTLGGEPVRPIVEELVAQVQASDKIEVILDALVVDHKGCVGDFTTGVQSGPAMYYQQIKHGVTIIATGGKAYKPEGYFYGKNPAVMTQVELGVKLAAGQTDGLDTVVMIQCVGSRNDANPACGRICCRSAVLNALEIKRKKPEATVVVLYRDMRTPYDSEDNYRLARELGVLFARYEAGQPPKVADNGATMLVEFDDPILGRTVDVEATALVLSTPQVADEEGLEDLCDIFKLQQTETGFLLEEHVKVRPVDTPEPGVFAAGSVLAPKSIDEAITQGAAAAGRAITVLAQESVQVSGGVAKVVGEMCAACLVCVRACPIGVPFINADGYSQIDPEKCLGCGICAAECPAKAIQLQGYDDDQIMGQTDALLEGVL
ncbi:FAD dependent oxidoreductase [Desulfarculus baarsii DSM 2075]|uniref:FAD dependent oxidoreductase n=1 Tax=Desulfarculus baarsii (strain ATCC 33931 / DSM 2075 / LMG 7858 / VKM B-1802 / 2st14) TaxID=644282 RepID=E1QIX2_DESB2|nr:FAD-dependent oxidoreductase [Desulfarculus baarsii]ADK85515.1 FAD dependent oxidoreductase [Desulfarculus baarsii DSM 2075]